MRRLTAEERALWARVAGTLDKRQRPEPPDRDPTPQFLPTKGMTAPLGTSGAVPVRVVARPAKAKAPENSNTLDASWDRALATGRIRPERTIDLHGHTLSTAHARLDRGLADAVRDEIRVILLVTGRAPRAGTSRLDAPLRGIIRASVGDWLAASPWRHRIAAIRGAHPKHGGAGALYIIMRRPRDH